MGFLVARPKLKGDEVVRWEAAAGRVVSPWTTSGGRLIVTDSRLIFQPNRFEIARAREPWDRPLGSVVKVAILDRDHTMLTSAVRKRLGIELVDGTETFIMSKLSKRIGALQSALRGA